MAKKKLWLLVPVVLAIALAAVLFVLRQPAEEAFILPDHIILCLDAGHGGDDPGAVNGERMEKDDNLKMALAVRDLLEAAGREDVEVILTREDDTALELEQRVTFANENDATLFISFHRNSGGGQGIETWISAEGLPHETQLATHIQSQLTAAPVTKDRGVKKGTAANPNASYYVVGHTKMPACLIELGFMDSQQDNAYLDSNFDLYARAIAEGILKMVERK